MGYGFAILTTIMLSGCAIASKLTLQTGFSPILLFFYGCGMAVLSLFLILVFTGRLQTLKAIPAKGIQNSISMGVFGFFLTSFFLLEGFNLLPTQLLVILINTWPIWLIIIHILSKYIAFSPKNVICLLVGFMGLCIAIGYDHTLVLTPSTVLGIGFVMGAAISKAVFSTLDTRFEYDAIVKLFIGYMAAFVCSIPIVLLEGGFVWPTLPQWAGILWVGPVGYCGAYVSWFSAYRVCNHYRLASIMYLTPCFSLLMCVFILGESLAITSAIGLAIVIVSLHIQKYSTQLDY